MRNSCLICLRDKDNCRKKFIEFKKSADQQEDVFFSKCVRRLNVDLSNQYAMELLKHSDQHLRKDLDFLNRANLARFVLILSVIETFMMDSLGSPNKYPSPGKFLGRITTKVTDSYRRIITENIGNGWHQLILLA